MDIQQCNKKHKSAIVLAIISAKLQKNLREVSCKDVDHFPKYIVQHDALGYTAHNEGNGTDKLTLA